MISVKRRNEILIIKNIEREASGLLETILAETGIRSSVIDLSLGDKLALPDKVAAVVILGGPDSANDQSAKMINELAFIREVLASGTPYLGICLGMQTLVKAMGGEVVKCPVKETGFRDNKGNIFRVSLTKEGLIDPLFDRMGDSFSVFQLHGESVVLTESMKLLGTGDLCRNQIVKAGPSAYGIQCHFELTEEMLERWIEEDADLMLQDKDQVRKDFISSREHYLETGRRLFLNFLKIAGLPPE